MVCAVRHVDGLGLADGLAVVQRLDAGEKLCVLVDDVRDAQQEVGALDRLDGGPTGLRRPGRLDRGVDVLLGGLRALSEDLAVRRVHRLEGPPVRSRPEGSVDV